MPLSPSVRVSLLWSRVRGSCARRGKGRPRPAFGRPALEALEDRTLLSTGALSTRMLAWHHNDPSVSGYLQTPDQADLYGITVPAGDVVEARIDAQDAGSALSSVLRVFDPAGRPIAINTGYNGPDPELTFQAAIPGTYSIGVSAAGNTAYDLSDPFSGLGHSTGLYTLDLTRLQAGATISTPYLPDLVSSEFQVSESTALWGDTVTVSYTIENRGGGAAGPFDSQVVLAPTNALGSGTISLGSIHLDGLAADSSVSGSLTVTLPGSPGSPPASFPEPGTVFLGLQVDSGTATVLEQHHGNNVGLHQGMNEAAIEILQAAGSAASAGIVVLPGPDARVVGQLAVGQTATYELTLTEAGRLRAEVQGQGVTTRLLLYDGQGRILVQSDGQAPTDFDNLIDQHLDPAGAQAVFSLEVEGLAGDGSYTLITTFRPTLSPVQTLPTGTFPYGVVSADFNGDGTPDLAVVDQGANEVRIYLGNGDGSFQAGQIVPTGAYPFSLAVGDFTGDGMPDLAVADRGTSTSHGDVRIYQGNGDGTFQRTPLQIIPVGYYANSLEAADFTGDGVLDLALVDQGVNSTPGDVRVLLGNGDGTFQAGQTLILPNGASPQDVVVGDFNGDGILDLAVSAQFSNSVEILLGAGDGTFVRGETIRLGAGRYPFALVAGDFTGLGRLDLAVTETTNRVQVLLNNGLGDFTLGQTIAVGNVPSALTVGDFTGNGVLDLAVTDFQSDDVRVLLGNGDGTFTAGQSIPVGGYPAGIVAGVFTGDGRLDLVDADQFSNALRVLVNNGDGTFQSTPGLLVGSNPTAEVVGDFTGDGRPDLAVADFGSNEVQVLLDQGDGSFQIVPARPAGYGRGAKGPQRKKGGIRRGAFGLTGGPVAAGFGPVSVVTGDFNGDGRLDLAVADQNSDQVIVLLGNGDGTFRVSQVIPVGLYPESLVVGDFTGDGTLDLAVADKGFAVAAVGDVRILLGSGNGTFRTGETIPLNGYPQSMLAGDFTGDGHLDLAVAEAGTDDVRVLLGKGNGTFQAGPAVVVGSYPASLVSGDFTGSGVLDLAVADQGSNDVRVLGNDGRGNFQQLGQPIPVGNSPSALVTGHFVTGGPLDLAVADFGANAVQVLLSNGDGTFTAGENVPVGDGPKSVVAADFTGDGILDLAVANGHSGDVTVLLGNGDGTFAPSPSGDPPGPAPSTPLLVDLSGDGTPDLIVRAQSGAILYRQAVAGAPGTFHSPLVINPGTPARDMTLIATPAGPMIAALDAGGGTVTFYHLDSGSFRTVETLTVPGGNGVRIAAGILGTSSLEDLVVSTALTNQLLVYFQQPDGTFTPPVSPALTGGGSPSDIQFADVNGDGLPDLVVTDQSSGAVEVVPTTGDPFAPAEEFAAGSGPYGTATGGPPTVESLDDTSAVLAGRFDEADPIDLLALNSGRDAVTLLRGTGVTGGFLAPEVLLNLDFQATAMVAGDFNRDDHLDLAFLDPQDDAVVVFFGDGAGNFLPTVFVTGTGSNPSGLAVADVNGDGVPDLLVGGRSGDVLVLIGKPDGTFTPTFQHSERNLALATFTGSDGTLLATANETSDRVTVQDPAGNTVFAAGVAAGVGAPSAVAFADLTGNGLPDLLVANSGDNELLVFLGTGPEHFGPAPLIFPVGSTPDGITVADLNGDGIPDVLVANEGSDTLSVLFGQGYGSEFTLVPGPQLATGPGPVASVVADLNGDRIPDIVVSNSQGDSVSVLRGLGFGYFADNRPVTIATGAGPGPLFFNHFSPAPFDLVTVNQQGSSLSEFGDFAQHISAHTTATQTLSSGGVDPVAAISGDFLGNGFTDLLVANSNGTVAVFAGGPNGLTLLETIRVSLGEITSLAFGGQGTVVVGGLGGVVTFTLPPELSGPGGFGPGPGGVPVSPAVGGTIGNLSPPASSSEVATVLFQPAALSSGATTPAESSAGTGTSGSSFDPLSAVANDAPVITVEVSSPSVQQGLALGTEIAGSLITGAGPATRAGSVANRTQRGGGAGNLIDTLGRDDDAGATNSSAGEVPYRPFHRLLGISYRILRPPLPDPAGLPPGARPAAAPPLPDQGRLLAPVPTESGAIADALDLLEAASRSLSETVHDPAVEGLLLALFAASVSGPMPDRSPSPFPLPPRANDRECR